jgi:ABC-type arginine transport system ATPase subunit
MKGNQIDRIVLLVIIVLLIFDDPLGSFDPVIECSIIFVLRDLSQNWYHVIYQIICMDSRDSYQPFLNANE